jgi:hypothetical protein
MMKEMPMTQTKLSNDFLKIIISLTKTTPETLFGVLEVGLKLLMIETGADHIYMKAKTFEINHSRTRFVPYQPNDIQSIIQEIKRPILFSIKDEPFQDPSTLMIELMNQRSVESLAMIPFMEGCFLAIESTSMLPKDTQVLELGSLLVSILESQLKCFQLNQDIEQSVTAKSEFLSNMSHEIRTPLSGIYNAFYLLNTTGLSHEQLEYVNNGMVSVDQLSSIIDDVLDYATIESGTMNVNPTIFDLELEMVRLYQNYKSMTDEKKLNLVFDFDYRLNSTFLGDISKIRQVIQHLLDNALKYTHRGNIQLKVSKMLEQDQYTWVMMTVADTGIGISKDDLDRIQDAFVQLDSSESKPYQGTGLGLSIAKQLISLMHGKLEVESTIHQGSTFYVSLPLIAQPQQHPLSQTGLKALMISSNSEPNPLVKALESMGISCFHMHNIHQHRVDLIVVENIQANIELNALKSTYGKPGVLTMAVLMRHQTPINDVDILIEWPISRSSIHQKINNLTHRMINNDVEDNYEKHLKGHALLVDDNRLNRVALQSILMKQGIRSTSAESGLKAIEIMKKESFDIIFMDIQMPTMDGLETTRRIRHLGPSYEKIPIIAITANQYFKDYDLMKSTQINDVLFKPIRMENLGQVLRKYISQERGIQIPETLVTFDETEFDERFEGSDDIAIEVMETFISEYTNDLSKIRHAIASKNAQSIYETTHYFKGSCSYLSGNRAVWLLDQISTLSKSGHLESMAMLLGLLESEIEELIKRIKVKMM